MPPRAEIEQLKAEFSSVRVVKEALNDHIPFSLLWAEESSSPAQKPGHRWDDQWNQLFDKRRESSKQILEDTFCKVKCFLLLLNKYIKFNMMVFFFLYINQ